MDFRNMKRKELQALCKKYNIRANLSNLDMANKLTEIFKETEKVKEITMIRGRSCLKGHDENVSEIEFDVVGNKKVKKVRFSPDHELIEFTRSREVKKRSRRKSTVRENCLAVENTDIEKAIAENVNIPGQVTQSIGQKLMGGGVNEKKRGRKRANVDDSKDIITSIDIENEKAHKKKVDSPDRVTRFRRQKLEEVLVNENKQGRKGKEKDVILANVGREGSGVVIRRSLRNREREHEGVRENVKEKEEVVKNEEILEENVILEPQIALRRSKRNANKAEDEGARKYKNDGRRCLKKNHYASALEASKVDADSATETKVKAEARLEVEGVFRLEDNVKVQSRRTFKQNNTMHSHENLKNEDLVEETKDRYQSTVMETGTTTRDLEDVKVSHHTGVTRRSRRRNVISQLVAETHQILDDETLENGKSQVQRNKLCLAEKGPVSGKNTRRSRRIAARHDHATMMDRLDGEDNVPGNVPGKNEARNRKEVCISVKDVIETENDPSEMPLRRSVQNSNTSENIAVKGKVLQKRKQPSGANKPNLVEESLEDISAMAKSFPVQGQLFVPHIAEITTDATLSCTEVATNINGDVRQTSCTKIIEKKRDASVELSTGGINTKEVSCLELENLDKNAAFNNVKLQIDNPECKMEISVSKSKVVVDNFHVQLETEGEKLFEDDISNSKKDEPAAALLFGQFKDFSRFNILGDQVHTSHLNSTGNSGFVDSSADGFPIINQSEYMTNKLEAIEGNVENSDNKIMERSAVNHVEYEVDIVQDNLDHGDLGGVNKHTSPIYCCHSDFDHLALTQIIEKDNETAATKAPEVVFLDSCGGNGNKTYIQENKHAEDPGFCLEPIAETSLETNISSEGDADNMKAARILEERELSLGERRICADTDKFVIGEDMSLHEKQDYVEYAMVGEAEISKKYEFAEPCHGNKSDTATSGNNIVADPDFSTTGTNFRIKSFSASHQSNVAEEDVDAFGLPGASEKQKQLSGKLREDQEAYDMTEEDKNFVHENLTISQDTNIPDREDSIEDADMHVDVANPPTIASPATNGYCACSMQASLLGPNSAHNSLGQEAHGGKREEEVTYFTKELYTESSISIVEKDALVGSIVDSDSKSDSISGKNLLALVMESMNSKKLDSSVSKHIGEEEIDAVGSGEEIWSKQSNTNGTEILQPIIGSEQAPAAVGDDRSCPVTPLLKVRDAKVPSGELKSQFATHVDAASTIQEKEALSLGNNSAGFEMSVHKTFSKGDEGTHSQTNESNEDDGNEPGLLVDLFATPVGIANSIQKKKARSNGSKAPGYTISLDNITGKGADESYNQDKNDNKLQTSFNFLANNTKPSEGKHDHDPAEIVDVAMSMDIASNNMKFESHFGLATESMDSEKVDTHVGVALREKEIDAGGSRDKSRLKQSNADRKEILNLIIGAQKCESSNSRLKQSNADRKEILNLIIGAQQCESSNSMHFIQGSSSILAATDEESHSLSAMHVGGANTTQEDEALSTGSKTARDAESLCRTFSKGDSGILSQMNERIEVYVNEHGLLKSLFGKSAGEHEIFSQADESSHKDKNAISMDNACNKTGFGSYCQMKSHKMEEEEYGIQNEHVVEHEFNHLVGTPIGSSNRGLPNGTSCHGTQKSDLNMSADSSISKMGDDELFDWNIQETGEKEGKNEKTLQAPMVQQTSSKVFETIPDVGLEGDRFKVLLATPVKSVTLCKANGTPGHEKSSASAAISYNKFSTAKKYKNSNTLQDDIDVVHREGLDEAGSVQVVDALATSNVCDASVEQWNEEHVKNPESIKQTQILNRENDQKVILSSGHLIHREAMDHGNEQDKRNSNYLAGSLKELAEVAENEKESEVLIKSEERTSQICKVTLAECEASFEKHYVQEKGKRSTVNFRDGMCLTSLDTSGISLYADEVEMGDLHMVEDVETNKGNEDIDTRRLFNLQASSPCSLLYENFHEDNDVMEVKDVESVTHDNDSYSVKATEAKKLEVPQEGSDEQKPNSEMAMENAVLQNKSKETNERHTVFQNTDNIYADENKEAENTEADTSNFNLTHDHMMDSEEVEENSTAILTKQQLAMLEFQLEEKAKFNSNTLAVSVSPFSGCHETLMESDVADTIKGYIDCESTMSIGIDNSSNIGERVDWEHATLVEPQAQSDLNLVSVDNENDEHTIETENKEVEKLTQLVDTACGSKEAFQSLAYADGGSEANETTILQKNDLGRLANQDVDHILGCKKACSTAKDARTILIHGTPCKALARGHMKENAPNSKRDNIGNITTMRPARRRALQDLQWN